MSDDFDFDEWAKEVVEKFQPYFIGLCSILGMALIPVKLATIPILTRIHRLLCHVFLVRLSSCGPWQGAIPLIYIALFLLFVADPICMFVGSALTAFGIFILESISGSLNEDGFEEEDLFECEEQKPVVKYASLEMMPTSSHVPYIIKCTAGGESHPVGGFFTHVFYNFEKFFINCHNLTKKNQKLDWEEVDRSLICTELCLLFPFDEGWGNANTVAAVKASKPEVLNLKTAQAVVTKEVAPPLQILRQVKKVMFSTIDVEFLLCLENASVVSTNVDGASAKGVVRLIEQWRAQERMIDWIRVSLSDVRDIKKAYFRCSKSENQATVSRGDLDLSIRIETDHVVLSTIPFCP